MNPKERLAVSVVACSATAILFCFKESIPYGEAFVLTGFSLMVILLVYSHVALWQ